MEIRPERPEDEAAISDLITAAFAGAEHSDGTEAQIVDRLRDAGALTLSLVAIDGGEPVGHIAVSNVKIDGEDPGWFGLGPLAVRPDRQNSGIGSALVGRALQQLRQRGAAGCVLVGEPDYYARFGFRADRALTYAGVPPRYFLALSFDGATASGTVAYHPAFG